MITLENEISNEELELETIENKYWADMWLALERLHDNPDFKKVILEGYFRDKAVNGVSMLAHPGTVRGGARPEVMEELVAISRLQDYFITIRNLGARVDDPDEDGQE